MTNTKQEPDADLVEQSTPPVRESSTDDYPPGLVSFEPQSLVQVPAPTSQADRLIELAIQNGADVQRLDQLLALKERYDKEEARKAYTQAMANFKSENISIKKDRTVSFPHTDGQGKTTYKHASLGNIIGIAVPALARHGLSHRWDCKREADRIEVRCVMTHSAGHSQETDWWPGPLDSSGKKNAIQQAASTVTYLERYTFLMITGLAVEEQDDDGSQGGGVEEVELITEDQQNEIHAMIVDNQLDMDVFLRWLANTAIRAARIQDIPADHFDKVVKKIKDTIKAQNES